MPRILVVDDDDSFRKMLRLALVKMGHEVREARNGMEAVALYDQEPADLVMTDIIMPEQDGLETIRIMRRAHPSLKIIAMSGGGRVNATDYLRIASSMRANRVLAKPFKIEEMAAVLTEVLGQPETHA
jgi:CheY-like chemotaxis protein